MSVVPFKHTTEISVIGTWMCVSLPREVQGSKKKSKMLDWKLVLPELCVVEVGMELSNSPTNK